MVSGKRLCEEMRVRLQTVAAALALLGAVIGAPAADSSCAHCYSRGTNWFDATCLYKPSDKQAASPASHLAPLLVQELSMASRVGGAPASAGFGSVGLSNGVPILGAGKPTVYWSLASVEIHGKPHTQASFIWCYRVERDTPGPSVAGGALQGIRITLNAAGRPAIWEVLSDSGACEQIYVSASLEAAAAATFGKPLAGRSYAVEGATNEASRVVVSRVIEDGPTIAGPIVYLTAGSHDVSTLICRCMPSQARELRENAYYTLAELDPSVAHTFDEIGKRTGTAAVSFWSPGVSPGRALERLLRLPKDF
jgi:hypothetical protein